MMRRRLQTVRVLLALAAVSLLALSAGSSSASASTSAWWLVNSSIAPTTLVANQEAEFVINAVDAGYGEASGEGGAQITLTDKLPAGVEVVSPGGVEGEAGEQLAKEPNHPTIILSCTQVGQTVTCPFAKKLLPTESIRLKVRVKVTAAVGSTLSNEVTITGGSMRPASVTRTGEVVAQPALHEPEPTKFGVESYELRPEDAEGNIETQAGAHPFQLSTTFDVNKTLINAHRFGTEEIVKRVSSPALAKNLHFLLPPGLIGNVAHMPQCSGADFDALLKGGINRCSGETAIGVGSVTVLLPGNEGDYTQPVPIFNLTPDRGEPARFGFTIHSVPVVLTTAVRNDKKYAVEVSVHYATEAADVLNSQVIIWGVPGDARHNSERGWACLGGAYFVEGLEGEHPCETPKEAPRALLSMPTVCESLAPTSTVSGESWPTTGVKEEEAEHTEFFEHTSAFESPFKNCGRLKFEPEISVQPDSSAASTPTGLHVVIKVPQSSTLSPTELAEADIRDTSLKLPLGMVTSGGAANRLQACSAASFGFTGFGEDLAEQLANEDFSAAEDSCPTQAKVGTVKIVTPLLEQELTGSVYLAAVHTAPALFEAPLVLYLVAEDPTAGVRVKLAGEVKIDPNTGQLTSTFENAPPLPFSELNLHLFEGEEATQSNPPRCGSYKSVAGFTSSSSTEAEPIGIQREPSFSITTGPADEGGVCPTGATLPFAPAFRAGVGTTQAGAFTPFTVTLERPDGNQALKTITVHEPAGAAAMLSSVNPCPTALAEQPEPNCPAESQIGESVAVAGLGSSPVSLPGKVYLTGPYNGAPFGLLSVTDATEVGPFDLGKIPVLSTITVDPTTAAATITSNPLPQFAPLPRDHSQSTGVPSQIKKLFVNVNRAGFTFNPTSCGEKPVVGVLTGYEGASYEHPAPFESTNCAALPFHPTIAVNVESNVSRSEGTGMKIVVTSGAGQSNIQKTKLVFPNTVPSRLTTIQKACPAQVFEANPATCPEGSVIGSAVAKTPVLKSPLTGPAYLVSHANESFPDAVFVLQGEGIKLVLDGKTNIKNGVTSSSFETVPDAPVETFSVTLPRGPHSAFSGYGNLCEKAIEVPTTFGGQNGALIENETKIKVEGCSGVLNNKTESALAKALKSCKKIKNKKSRAKCETTARLKAALTACKKQKNKKARVKCETAARKKYKVKKASKASTHR